MANTWSFFPDAATVIKGSMRRIRAYDPEDATTITAVQYANALETLNYIMSSWQALGMQLWCRKLATKVPVASQTSYTVGSGGNIAINRPLSIFQAYKTNSQGVDIPLRIIGQQEYHQLSRKAQTGDFINLYYDPTYDAATNSGSTSTGTVYLWPTPDANAAAEYTLKFLYQRPLEDFDATSDKIDMPQEWYNVLRLELAVSIAPEYGMPVTEYDRLVKERDYYLELAKSWDVEQNASVKFHPDTDRFEYSQYR